MSVAVKEPGLFARIDEQLAPVVENVPSSRKYLVFMVNDEGAQPLKFGVDAEYVVELQNSYAITYLPMMPDYVPGIFNMRGQIIPIMDIRLRLGKFSNSEEGLLIVLNYNGTQIGLLADAVDRIIDIPDQAIASVPSQETQRFVSGICTIPDSVDTMMVLDCEQLLAHE